MIERIFADTSGFVALGNEDDFLHIHSQAILAKLPPFLFVTTNFVVAETLTRLRYDTHHSNAVGFGEMLLSSRNIEIIRVGELLEEKA
jgi:predicted nucleic acid-binding protein